MIPARRPPKDYTLKAHSPSVRLGRATRSLWAWLARTIPATTRACCGAIAAAWRARFGLLVVAVLAFVALEPTTPLVQVTAVRAELAKARADNARLAAYHLRNTVRLSLEGNPRTVQELAGQFASVPK